MLSLLINPIKSLRIRTKRLYDKMRLKNRSFTIISNNCWGGFVYQKFGLPYQSPTVGCGILDDHYFKFCSNLRYYLSQELVFIDPKTSLDYKKRKQRYGREIDYPVGRLDDVEIWFTHYKTREDAKEKWIRRCNRINFSNLLIKWSKRNSDSESGIDEFLELPYQHKIAFVSPDISFKHHDIITIPELTMLNKIGGGDETPYTFKHFDILRYLNVMNKNKQSGSCAQTVKV